MGLKFRSICWPQTNQNQQWLYGNLAGAQSLALFIIRVIDNSLVGAWTKVHEIRCIYSLKMVLSDEELELGLNLMCKIGLKHFIPVSNCFNRRKTFVAMTVSLKSQMATAFKKSDGKFCI